MTPATTSTETEAFSPRHAVAFALLFLSLMSDGFDLQSLAFAAPGMVRDWGVAKPLLAPAFSAGLLGVLVGAPTLGWVGDRLGRKQAIVIGSVIFGVLSLLTAGASGVAELVALRFLTGIGLGGVLPNVIALAAETAPRRLRPMLTALVTVGISLGGVTVGLTAAAIVPRAGWSALFVVGGAIPLVVALLIALLLPRSVQAAPASTPDPATAIPSTALLGARWRGITALIWLLFAGLLMALYLLSSWLPLVLESDGMSPRGAALMNTMLQFGGVVGGVGASLLIGRYKLRLVPLLLGGALTMLVLLAVVSLHDVVLGAALGLCGIFVIGGQTAINASAGLIYPIEMRARGVGAALGVGRLGSILGPLVGGAIMSLGHGARTLFLGPVGPLGLAFVAALVLVRHARFDRT